jgi:hypothetical protein
VVPWHYDLGGDYANQYFARGNKLDHGTDFATAIDDMQNKLPTNAQSPDFSDLYGLIPKLLDRIEYRNGLGLRQEFVERWIEHADRYRQPVYHFDQRHEIGPLEHHASLIRA